MFSLIILKENFSPKAPEIFTETDYLTWVECLTLRQSPLLQLRKQMIFKEKFILHKGILNAE